jgi:hypothetical protein
MAVVLGWRNHSSGQCGLAFRSGALQLTLTWTRRSLQSEELRQAVLSALGNKLMHGTPRKKPQREPMDLVDLRAATDAIAYEDWAVDYNQVRSVG